MQNGISYNLDDKIVATAVALMLAFTGLLAFRYSEKEPCTTVNFTYRTPNAFDVVYTNEPVYFSSAYKNNADNWEWDFGDKTAHDTKSGPYCIHEYRQPGQYTVRLIIDKKCEEARTINVNKREDKGKKLYPMPLWPAEPLLAGREYNFSDSTTGAVTCSWYFDNEPKRLQRNLTYLFTEPGEHKVVLVINDDIANNRVEKTFKVLEPPKLNSQPLPVKPSPSYNTPQSSGGGGSAVNMNKEIHDKLPGLSMEQIATETKKIPTVSDEVLRGHLLKINGSGYNEIRKYLRKGNYETCTILFNNRPVSVDKLKELINTQNEFGKTFDIKQSINPDNYIILISITATLEPKKRWIGKDKERDYNYK